MASTRATNHRAGCRNFGQKSVYIKGATAELWAKIIKFPKSNKTKIIGANHFHLRRK